MMAAPVSHDLVTQVWQEMSVLSIHEVRVLIEQMQAEQPALMAYLLALEGYGLSREELEEIFHLGIVVWQMMKREHPRLMRVPLIQREQAEEENTNGNMSFSCSYFRLSFSTCQASEHAPEPTRV